MAAQGTHLAARGQSEKWLQYVEPTSYSRRCVPASQQTASEPACRRRLASFPLHFAPGRGMSLTNAHVLRSGRMKAWISRGSAVLLIGSAFAAQAQQSTPAPTDDEISEEILVAAQKRATALQEVPFSIAAMTNQDIKESGATNIVEIARNVPGLYITDLGPGQSQVAIRGISAGQVVRDQPGVKESVGIYLDESPISVALFTPDLDLYDLDRIEVLRGPQGTLYGAGNDAGTVRYITAQPNVGRFGGSIEMGFNGLSNGELGNAVRSAVNVPLGENAAMRVVGYYNELAGFIDSVYPDRETREDVNSGRRTGGRVAFRFEPNENLTI